MLKVNTINSCELYYLLYHAWIQEAYIFILIFFSTKEILGATAKSALMFSDDIEWFIISAGIHRFSENFDPTVATGKWPYW